MLIQQIFTELLLCARYNRCTTMNKTPPISVPRDLVISVSWVGPWQMTLGHFFTTVSYSSQKGQPKANGYVKFLIENPIDSTTKLLNLISEFSKTAGYKVNIQKLKAFLYTSNEISETEIREKSHLL